MTSREPASLGTRPSLVAGLQAGDEDRWAEFFRLYGPVLRNFARKAGCSPTEADEVVQETCIGLARNVEGYRYDPARCRFKSWLLTLASWRVKNQLARRRRQDQRQFVPTSPEGTALPVDVPDPAAGQAWEALWETEWREGLLAAGLERVRSQVSEVQYQIFDLNVLKEWPAGEVARSVGVSLASVYLAKLRVGRRLREEIRRLEAED